MPASASATYNNVDIACMQDAVDKREAAVRAAAGVYTQAWLAALDARASALHDAWAMSDRNERRAASKDAWMDYRDAKRSAKMTYREAQNDAWATFAARPKIVAAAPRSTAAHRSTPTSDSSSTG